MTSESLILIDNVPIKNVREFKYLGHMMSNLNKTNRSHLNQSISSAFKKWNELKHVLTDQKSLYENQGTIP